MQFLFSSTRETFAVGLQFVNLFVIKSNRCLKTSNDSPSFIFSVKNDANRANSARVVVCMLEFRITIRRRIPAPYGTDLVWYILVPTRRVATCNDNDVYLVLCFFVIVVCGKEVIPSVMQLWIGVAFGVNIDDEDFNRAEWRKI